MPQQFKKAIAFETSFRLGDRLVEPRLNRVTRDGESIQLEIKAMDVLVCLARRAGDVVSRQEIIDEVWATEFISDNTLTHAIAELRTALGDDARNPSFIETIHRRGYRIIAPVEEMVPDDPGGGSVAQFPISETSSDDEAHPYPGLASFTEDDAEFFFGREEEIAKIWRELSNCSLLAVIGPSGSGKSSLIRAGVMAQAPDGWRSVICQPSEEPFLAVAQSLAPDLADDPDGLRKLLSFHDPEAALAVCSRWRARWDDALLVVDQFEELFTLNPEPVQRRFVELLRSLVDAAGIRVMLVMRDDFFFNCHHFRQLAPVFNHLIPIGPPSPDGLRRALTEPAARQRYAFEDHELADEMVAEVQQLLDRDPPPEVIWLTTARGTRLPPEVRLLLRERYRRTDQARFIKAGAERWQLRAKRDRLPPSTRSGSGSSPTSTR